MEFPQRGVHQNQTAGAAASSGSATPSNGVRGKKESMSMWMRVASMAMLLGIAVVLFGTVVTLAKTTSSNNDESRFVNGDQYQAVFLNGGQVYFGRITSLNSKYLRLRDIYYLRVNQTVQPNQATSQASSNDVSLVKLGCELHGPQDEMLINRDQTVFWENLKGDGQVAKAVADYKTQNPDGQKCDAAASATPSTTTPAKKP